MPRKRSAKRPSARSAKKTLPPNRRSNIRVDSAPLFGPIYRLPIELLAEIFCIAAKAHRKDVSSYFWRNHPALVIRDVCRRWRALADDISELWTLVSLRRSANARLFLQNSKSLPISVRVQEHSHQFNGVDNIDGAAFHEVIYGALDRVVVISIGGRFSPDQWSRTDYKRIVTELREFMYHEAIPRRMKVLHLPADAFKNDGRPVFHGKSPPNLQELRINLLGYNLSTVSGLLRAPLQKLELTMSRVHTSSNLNALTEVLRILPTLRTLTLEIMYTVWDFNIPAAWGVRRFLRLPCLENVSITARLSLLCPLFSIFALPPSANVYIDWSDKSMSGREEISMDMGIMGDLRTSLEEHFAPLAQHGFHFCTLESLESSESLDTFNQKRIYGTQILTNPTFAGSNPANVVSTVQAAIPHLPERLTIVHPISTESDSEHAYTYLSGIVRCPGFKDLREIRLVRSREYGAQLLTSLFSIASGIESIYADRNDVWGLLTALTTVGAYAGPSLPESLPLPALRRMHLQAVRLALPYGETRPEVTSYERIGRALILLIKERKARGMVLPVLDIRGSDISDQIVMALRELLPPDDLRWDGVYDGLRPASTVVCNCRAH